MSDLLLAEAVLMVGVEELADLFILVLNVLQILLASEEIMLILAAVVPAITKWTKLHS